MVTPAEAFLSLGFPTCAVASAAAKVDLASMQTILHSVQFVKEFIYLTTKDQLHLDDLAPKKLFSCAGNGMSLPCVAFATLIAVIGLQPKA